MEHDGEHARRRDRARHEIAHLRDEAAILFESYLARPLLRGVSHLIGFVVALIAIVLLALQAAGAMQLAASLVYGLGLVAMLGTSALFHRVRWRPRAYKWVRRIDHSMIFVLIATTYTPFVLLALDGWMRWAILVTVWMIAGAGVVLRLSVEQLPRALQVGLYVGLGWMAVMLVPALDRVSVVVLVFAAAGGVLYTIGGAVYLFERPNPLPRVFGFHEVFHAFVVAAATCHFLAVWPLVTSSPIGA